MSTTGRLLLPVLALVGLSIALGGVMNERRDDEIVDRYRAALNAHDVEAALSHLADDFRLHFVGTEFVMSKSDLRRILGWDVGVQGQVEWEATDDGASPLTFQGRERNQFFELLGIAYLRFRTTFRLDDAGRIAEQWYEVEPGQTPVEEAMKPALAWARTHRPAELRAIYPEGRLVYTEEMGRRWVVLLREWRSATSP